MKSGDRIGNYEVGDLIGQGGMATVWRVRHATLDSAHALKVLHIDGAQVRERLIQEGRIQAGLVHPNIVRVTDVVEMSGKVGLVMDFVDGASLRELLDQEGAMNLAEALGLFGQILDAIEAAHERGILHRDLKPDNVLLSQEGGKVIARVADFGIAKALDGGLRAGQTRDGTTMGSPGYMAPEQVFDSGSATERSDLFAAGSLLYEMVSGRRAFDGTNVERIQRTQAGTYTPLEALVPGIPAAVADIVARCLKVEPAERPRDVAEIRAALAGTLPAGAGTASAGATETIVPRSAPRRSPETRVTTGRVLALVISASMGLAAAAFAYTLVDRAEESPPAAESETAPEPAPETVGSAPAQVRAPERASTSKKPAGPSGTVTLEVRPTSTIRIDGKTKGKGKWSGALSAGSHMVEFQSLDGKKLQELIEVTENGTVALCWDFQRNGECAP